MRINKFDNVNPKRCKFEEVNSILIHDRLRTQTEVTSTKFVSVIDYVQIAIIAFFDFQGSKRRLVEPQRDNRQALLPAACAWSRTASTFAHLFRWRNRSVPKTAQALVLPPATPDAPAELSLPDSAFPLLRLFAVRVLASAPARHRRLS